jgi:anti-sigma-K factor RskA
MADELDLAAAEYVLGTLDGAERRAFAGRLAGDPAAARAVASWSERLAPMLTAIPEVEPPAGAWRKIEAAIGRDAAANDNSAVRWRIATLAASLVALAMTGVAWRESASPTAPAAVAALSSQGGAPAVLVTYDRSARRLRIMPVAMPVQPGRSFELWMIAGGAAPKSMGLLGDHAFGLPIVPADETTFAVSVEPVGGSPTGAPTGPVLWSGKLMPVSPDT